MGFLDELKQQAKAKAVGTAANDPTMGDAGAAEQAKLTARVVDARMQDALKFMRDVAENLKILKLETPRSFAIETAGRMEGLRLVNFRVDTNSKTVNGRNYLDYVSMSFSQAAERKALSVVRDAPLLVDRLKQFLHHGNIKYTFNELKNDRARVTGGSFRIPHEIRSSVVLHADHAKGHIAFAIRNVDRITSYEKSVSAEKVDATLLDSLVAFVIGNPSTFQDVSPSTTPARTIPLPSMAKESNVIPIGHKKGHGPA